MVDMKVGRLGRSEGKRVGVWKQAGWEGMRIDLLCYNLLSVTFISM